MERTSWLKRLFGGLRTAKTARANTQSTHSTSGTTSRSTAWLEELPDVEGFLRRAQSLAALDAIVCPEWDLRYYSFDAQWADGHRLASMRNGSGDHWFALITEHGIAVHGLAHESRTYAPGKPKPWVFAGLPEVFDQCFLREPAFDTQHSTYCLWRLNGSAAWSRGPVPTSGADDGAQEGLALLTQGPEGYRAWAEEYHELALPLAEIAAVFLHEPITPALAKRLNPAVDFEALQKDLHTIGYP